MTTIITSTEIITMPIEAFGAWLRQNGLTVVKVIKGTWPPKIVCVERKGRGAMIDLEKIKREYQDLQNYSDARTLTNMAARVPELIAEVERLREESQRRMDRLLTFIEREVDFVGRLSEIPAVDA